MSFPPVAQSTIAVSNLLSRLGIKGGRIPGIGAIAVPTIQIGDFGSTLASEQVEARAMSAANVNAQVSRFPAWELPCRTAGGLVVEYLWFSGNVENLGNRFVRMRIDDSSLVAANPGIWTECGKMDMGGTPTKATPYCSQEFPAAFLGIQLPDASYARQANFSPYPFPKLRCYVPPGAYLQICHLEQDATADYIVVWREFEEVLGAP